MNHKQINDLKPGDRFELREEYVYGHELATETIPKGTKMEFIYPVLGSWRFRFDRILPGFLGIEIGFGRSRLLKLRVKKITGEVS